jgi:predicted DCC family thiol-disulfide oxidoreductase YuxK
MGDKPLLVYDGDCAFCRRWVARWQAATGDAVDYAPYQQVAARYPLIPIDAFKSAVQLIEPNGRVTSGAGAALRTLALGKRAHWLLWSYQHVPGFAPAAERIYEWVARHRGGLDRLDRWTFGQGPQLPSYFIARGVFLRLLGVIYLIAFLSYWVQIDGLIGSNGISPIGQFLDLARQRAPDYYATLPTLSRWNASDSMLHWQCGIGVGLALALIAGLLPMLVSAGLFVLYLSLTAAGQQFLGFQWDALLLEAGFLSIFTSPFQWRLTLSRPSKPPVAMIWLLRWLVFRVMFLSGVLKWTAGDVIWHGLTAMKYHYETQPLPTWTSWYAHYLPGWFQVFSALMVFIVEGLVPVLYFLPRRLRAIGCWFTVTFQCLIMATGNYGFFNLLTIVLCVPLLDDQSWPLRRFGWPRVRDAVGTPATLRRRWPNWITVPLAAVLFTVTTMTVVDAFRPRQWSSWLSEAREWTGIYRVANGYGLFRVMTQDRPEIILEGSDDGVHWLAYEFKWKPGDPMRRPRFCIGHMPRLDWQMWFAALAGGRENWLVSLNVQILKGSPRVLDLLERNPFPQRPPRFARAVMYDYHFSDPATRNIKGAWWIRRRLGVIFTLEQRPGTAGVWLVPG